MVTFLFLFEKVSVDFWFTPERRIVGRRFIDSASFWSSALFIGQNLLLVSGRPIDVFLPKVQAGNYYDVVGLRPLMSQLTQLKPQLGIFLFRKATSLVLTPLKTKMTLENPHVQ